MRLRLDDCSHCACSTELVGYESAKEIIDELERGECGCDNCMELIEHDGDVGHGSCVALFDENDVVLWDGRHK